MEEHEPVCEKQDIIFYFLSWYATPERLPSHWYTFYSSLYKLTDRANIRVLCREDLVQVGPFIPALPKFGFRRSFFPLKQSTLESHLEKISLRILQSHENSVFFAYEGGVRELQILLGLAKKFPGSKPILNFYNVEQWEEALKKYSFVRALIDESREHGVTFTSEFPDNLPPEIRNRLPQVSGLPLFSSITPLPSQPEPKNRNLLILSKSVEEINLHADDMETLSSKGWNLRIQSKTNYELSNGTVLEGTGVKEDQNTYQQMLSSNAVTVFMYDPDKFARKSSGKLEDVISVKSIPIVPKNTGLEVQNQRQLVTFEWGQAGSIVAAVEKLNAVDFQHVLEVTPDKFLNFLEDLTSKRVNERNLQESGNVSRERIRLGLMDRGSVVDFFNALLVWTGSHRVFKRVMRGPSQ